jgi:flagellar motor switch protein FliM
MSEPLLTSDEKNALLEGVSSGAVDVRAGGTLRPGNVRRYEVPAGARIVTHGHPRLKALNQRLAERLSADFTARFQRAVEVTATALEVCDWDACRRQLAEPAVHFLFTAAPLAGNGMVVLEADLVRRLVDAFFGHSGATAWGGTGALTRGERSVAARCCDMALEALRDVWQPLVEIAPQRVASELPLELVDLARDADPVLACGFELALDGAHGAFRILWPRAMVAPLLPVFDGRPGERDAAADARWEQAIRRRLADVPVRVATVVGDTRHPVGRLAALTAGTVLGIANPRAATVLAGGIPIIRGRFGVLGGRNAVEAAAWLDRERPASDSFEEH